MLVQGRIQAAGVAYTAAGKLSITLDRRPSIVVYGPHYDLNYVVMSAPLTIRSSNNGIGGRIQTQTGATDACPPMGFTDLTTVSTVDQIRSAATDFEVAGVQIGDLVYTTAGALVGEVEELLDEHVIRLDSQVLGTLSATLQIRHGKYQRFNELNTALAVFDGAPTYEDFLPYITECLRAPKTHAAANAIRALASTLAGIVTTMQTAATTYRTVFTNPSSYMLDCRRALEESGADRAVELLEKGDLAGLFGATTDDATHGRRLMRSIRNLSRTLLGTSVFSPAIQQEAEALSMDEPLDLSVDIPPAVDIGPPGVTRR